MAHHRMPRTAMAAALATALAGIAFATSGARAEDSLRCGSGFSQTSQTADRITCIRSRVVASQAQADKIMKVLARKVVCNGEVRDPKSSVGQSGDGLWQVTVRFICSGD